MSTIKIYIGNQIEYESDRVILQHVYGVLSEQKLNAIIFANVHLERQIDLIVALDKLILVIEAKGCSFPLRGGKNGNWEYEGIYGWESCGINYYNQALSAMHQVRDAIKKLQQTNPPYPTAILAFIKPIYDKSLICPPDLKVKIIELKDFYSLLLSELNKKNSTQDLSVWERFAKSNNLKLVENIRMALDDKLQKAKETLDIYCNNFQRYYSGCINDLILNEELSNTLRKIKEQTINNIILLRGPSGCGKTLIAYKLAIDCLQEGNIPIILEAKYFKEDVSMIKTMLAHELGLLSVCYQGLLDSIKRLDKSILFILDGYNECKEIYQSSLIRSFLALCNNYNSFPVITSNKPIKVSFPITNIIEEIISYPVSPLKISIAQRARMSELLPSQLELLEVVTTCFDAKIVGEAGDDLRSNMSLFMVYDTYIRKQLGEFALDGIKILSAIADSLNKKISFSLSIREIERIIQKTPLNTNILTLLFNKNFLIRSKDQVSFFHEVYLHFFTAESVIRSGSPENIVKDLYLPLHNNDTRKEFVIGAIEDVNLQKEILSDTEDPLIIKSCILGRCGLFAKEWGKKHLKNTFEKIQIEISGITCHIDEENKSNARPTSSSNITWTSQDHAFFTALAYLCVSGQFLEELFSAIKAMDIILAAEYKRLRQEGSNIKNLRSIIFTNTYTFENCNKLAISYISTLLQDEAISYALLQNEANRAESPKIVKFIEEKLSDENLSPGQFFVLLSLFNILDLRRSQIRVNLSSIFNKYWHSNYNIRLSLLDVLRRFTSLNTINKEERYKIIEMLEKSLCSTGILNAYIMEVLEGLGALEDENNKEILNIRLDIQKILKNPLDKNSRIEACFIWSSQFDHLYNAAYSEALSELTSKDKKALLLMASGEYDINGFWAPILLSQLVCFRDPSVASTIVRFASLPINRKFEFSKGCITQIFDKDGLSRFIVAYISLGIFNSLLPPLEIETLTNREEVLIALGRIFYWSNRSNLSIETKKRKCFPEVQKLLNYSDVSVAILAEIRGCLPTPSLNEYFNSYDRSEYISEPISIYFPDLLCQICRKFLTNPINCKSYSHFGGREHKFAITSLASFGGALDIEILKIWKNDRNYGIYAINGIKNLNKKNFD